MKIVVVEDEAVIRNGLANMLPKLKPYCEVVGTAMDGETGLALIEQTRPDLVIMDIQMPKMDGLTMLGKLRERGNSCRAVVLTAYSDFSYAKQAIELNIENYLLKPIKIPELTKTLEIIQESLDLEKGTKNLLSLEQIFRGSVLAELPIDGELNQVMKEKYNVGIEEELSLFSVWLGDQYDTYVDSVMSTLQECKSRATLYEGCVLASERNHLVLVVLYHMSGAETVQKHFAESIVPVLVRGMKPIPVFTWGQCEGLEAISECYARVLKERKWNLAVPKGTLITSQVIEQIELVPIHYPMDADKQIRQAVAQQSRKEIEACFYSFFSVFGDQPHHPDEIREICMRFCVSVISLAKKQAAGNKEISAQSLFERFLEAFTMEKIWEILRELFLYLLSGSAGQESDVSLMVKQAGKLIEEGYSQGITLEEISQKLCVSEEYLSTQFKKETGSSFTETIRRCRIEKVKELLLHSNLKLNQIAEMVGYSDPKYMSKVFKEEEGILPAEYRKIHI